MRKYIESYPFHVFLIVVYLVFFLYTNNAVDLPLAIVIKPLLYFLVFVTIVFFCFLLIFKNKIKAGVATTFVNLPLLSYGIAYDLLEKLYVKGYWPLVNIHRYLILASLFYIIFVLYYVFKKLKNGTRLNYLINVLIITLITINALSYAFALFRNPIHKQTGMEIGIERNTKSNKPLPNVYHIVMDGYANQHILKKYYGFDNSNFITFLKEKGFYVADSSVANYYNTILSLNATLNMQFNYDLAGTQNSLNNNLLFRNLKRNGYKIYELESGYSVTGSLENVDSIIEIGAPSEFELILMKYSIIKLDDMFGFMHHLRLKGQIDKLQVIKNIGGTGKFFFIHIVSPHPPFVFNENGEHVYSPKNNDKSWEPKSKYIQQMKYFNSVLKDFISEIVQKDTNQVIVLQSDHGPWIKSSSQDEIYEARSMILNALRMPSVKDSVFYKNISAINTFRIFNSTYFGESWPLLKDSAAGKSIIYNAVLFKNLKENEGD